MSGNNKIMAGWFGKTIKDWAIWITCIISLAIALFGDEGVLRCVKGDVGLAQIQIGTALLGIVLAGLAILVIFLDEKYIAILEKVPPGFDADLWPFKYTALIAIFCAVFGMALIIIGYPPTWLLRLTYWLSLWSFSYLLWVLFDLIKFVAGHAKARVTMIRKNKDPK